MANELSLGNSTTYLVIVAVVAVVAVVSLIFGNGSNLQGAPVIVDNQMDQVFPCQDTDAADDIYTYGHVSYGRLWYDDECRGDMLYQYSCASSNQVEFTPQRFCENGCERGACLR